MQTLPKLLSLLVAGVLLVLVAAFFWYGTSAGQRLQLPVDENFSNTVITVPQTPGQSFTLRYYAGTIDIGASWRYGKCNGDLCLVLPLDDHEQNHVILPSNGEQLHLYEFNISYSDDKGRQTYNKYIGLFSSSPGEKSLQYHGSILVGGQSDPGIVTEQGVKGGQYIVEYIYDRLSKQPLKVTVAVDLSKMTISGL